MTLKRVTLGFESCEVVDIPAAQVAYLRMSGITTTQFYRSGEDVENISECSACEIHITKAAGEIPMEWQDATLADRLQGRDIVTIDLDYGDHLETYYVKWSDASEMFNEWMEVANEGDEIHISIHQ